MMVGWRVALGSVALLLLASIAVGDSLHLSDESKVHTASLELERKVEPWCPGDCAVGVPFVASYRKGAERLVFVGAHHTFAPDSPTMRAVAEGFHEFEPRVLIVEGFPTELGENPAPLVSEARLYGTSGADEYSRGEAMYAASIALAGHVPFVGGEPTRKEQNAVLKRKGFTDSELAFSAMLGALSQALRSGDIPNTSAEALTRIYPELVMQVGQPATRGGWALAAPSLDGFQKAYRDLYGVNISGDEQFPLRIDVGDKTRHGDLTRVDMKTRNRHLLGLIEKQLTLRHQVLVVFGSSHWATLSTALEDRLGKPEIEPFLK